MANTFTITKDANPIAASVTAFSAGTYTLTIAGDTTATVTYTVAAGKTAAVLDFGVYGTLAIKGTAATMSFTAGTSFPKGYGKVTLDTTFTADGKITVADYSNAAGAITLSAADSADLATITGSAYADNITATAAATATTINGGAGNDTLVGGSGAADLLNGGEGNDSIKAAFAGDSVNGGAGDDTVDLGALATTNVTLGAGADTVIVDVSKAQGATDYSYADGDVVKLTTAYGSTPISLSQNGVLTAGSASVSVPAIVDNTYKAVVADTTATREYWTVGNKTAVTLDASAKANAVVMDATKADSAVITTGYGNDTVSVAGAAVTLTANSGSGSDSINGFDLGTDGDVLNLGAGLKAADVSMASGQKAITLSGDGTTIDGILTTSTNDILRLTENGGTEKKIYVDMANSISVDATKTVDAYKIFGTGVSLDASAAKTNQTWNMQGSVIDNSFDTIVGAAVGGTYIGKSKGATTFDLGNDTVGSVVYGGSKYNDTIKLNGTNKKQDTVWFGTTDGADSVSGFTSGFDTTSDVVYLYDVADAKTATYTKSNDHAAVSLASGQVAELNGADIAANGVQLLVQDKTGVKKIAAGLAAAANINGTNADYVKGTTDKDNVMIIDATAATDSTQLINLADTTKYANIYKANLSANTASSFVVAGNSDAPNNITLGGAASTVWGGSKNADNVTLGSGKDEVWYFATDGKDTVKKFDKANDTLHFWSASMQEIASNYSYAGGVFTVDTDNELTVRDTDDAVLAGSFKIADKNSTTGKAVVGAALSYDADAKLYMGTSVVVGAAVGAGTSATVYLGNGTDMAFNDVYYSKTINAIDASSSKGTLLLVGSAAGADNITGGQGYNVLWGGGYGNDVLNGQTGVVDEFWFGKTDGTDAVSTGVDKGDKVVLYDVASINDVKMTVSTASYTISTGSSQLTVTDANTAALKAGLTFQVGVGSSAQSYTWDTTTSTFKAKA